MVPATSAGMTSGEDDFQRSFVSDCSAAVNVNILPLPSRACAGPGRLEVRTV